MVSLNIHLLIIADLKNRLKFLAVQKDPSYVLAIILRCGL